MTNPIFPPLLVGLQNSAGYAVEYENVGMKTPLEGGYVASRPRHTRKPRKSFKVTFTMMLPAEKVLLEDFYGSVFGSSVIFDWKDPILVVPLDPLFPNGTKVPVVHQVRFADKLTFTYTGVGPTQRWDVDFMLEQA